METEALRLKRYLKDDLVQSLWIHLHLQFPKLAHWILVWFDLPKVEWPLDFINIVIHFLCLQKKQTWRIEQEKKENRHMITWYRFTLEILVQICGRYCRNGSLNPTCVCICRSAQSYHICGFNTHHYSQAQGTEQFQPHKDPLCHLFTTTTTTTSLPIPSLVSNQGCPTSWHLWATMEEEGCLGPHIKYTNTNENKIFS